MAEWEINLASSSNPPITITFCKDPREFRTTAEEPPGHSRYIEYATYLARLGFPTVNT